MPPEDVKPTLDGLVLAANKDGLVEISLGSDDGLERGHTLEVFRGSRYLGRIEVFQDFARQSPSPRYYRSSAKAPSRRTIMSQLGSTDEGPGIPVPKPRPDIYTVLLGPVADGDPDRDYLPGAGAGPLQLGLQGQTASGFQ